MDFIILSLAVWRISNLMVNESGPYTIFEWLRYQVGVRYNEQNVAYATNEFGEVFTCVFCLSVWLGLFCAVLYYFYPVMVYWVCLPFALSAVACVVNKWMQ